MEGGPTRITDNGRGAAGIRFALWLSALTLLGVLVQLWFVLDNYERNMYDALKYSNDAGLLASGHGFVGSEAWFFDGIIRQSAIHPPLTTMWLAVGSLVGFAGLGGHQLWMLLPGGGVVAVIGLLGRRVAGDRVGLVAAGLAASHPGVWSFPATVMAETPAQFFIALALLAAYRWRADPVPLRAATVAAAAALAGLARSENLVFLGVLLLGIVLARGAFDLPARTRTAAAAALWAGTLLAPWLAFNYVRFDPPALYATGFDITLVSSNCPSVYSGSRIGYWRLACRPQVDAADGTGAPKDEAAISAEYRAVALENIRDGRERLPAVMVARLQRTFSIGNPSGKAAFEGAMEGRRKPAVLAASYAFFASLPLAAAGAWLLRRRGQVVWPLVLPALLAAIATSVVTHGTTRYRIGLDVGLIVLSAVALEHGWRRWRGGAPHPRSNDLNGEEGQVVTAR